MSIQLVGIRSNIPILSIAKHAFNYDKIMLKQVRVSGTLSNAPFILNVDCDMYVNNPLSVRHAMCLILGSKNEGDSGFVQFPQVFYDGPKDDPYGNQYVAFHEVFSTIHLINKLFSAFYYYFLC